LANHKSALKRIRQNEKRRLRNKSAKTRMRSLVKAVHTAAASSPEGAAAQLDGAKSQVAKAAKKGVIHKKTAARIVSRLSKATRSTSANSPAA
jgi:small subunit ribosomal protein S20